MSDAKALIEKMPQAFDADAAGDMNATVQYAISTPMHMQIANGECTVHEGESGDADVTFKMEDEDLVKLLTGELDGMSAFMTGQLQVEGDIMLAQKIPTIFDANKLS